VYYNISGGNHFRWWPYLEYGGAYTVSYADGTISLTGTNTGHSGNFFSSIYGGGYTLVVEFYDGSRVDIPLDVAGDPVTSGTNKSSGDAAGPSQPTYEPPATSGATTTPISITTTSPTSPTSPTSTVSTNSDITTTPETSESTGLSSATPESSDLPGVSSPTTDTSVSTTSVSTDSSESTTSISTDTSDTSVSTTPVSSDTPESTTPVSSDSSDTSDTSTSPTVTTAVTPPTVTSPETSPTTTATAASSATTTKPLTKRLVGDVDLNGSVTINDALEVLKYLAKLSSELDNKGEGFLNALVTEDNPDESMSPTINDALEILKFLAKLDSKAGKLVDYQS
ncbi:MAG: hypothetical protein FWF82_07900, partial [Oscillospiraceae bacterium]|nr:hypothetical protein [Oscillospiraceae bacterium]